MPYPRSKETQAQYQKKKLSYYQACNKTNAELEPIRKA